MTIKELIETLHIYGETYGYNLTVCNSEGVEFEDDLTFGPTNNDKVLLLTADEEEDWEYLTNK